MSETSSFIDETIEICPWGLWPSRLRQLTESSTCAAFTSTFNGAVQDMEKLSYFILYAQYGPEELCSNQADQLMLLLDAFNPDLSSEDAFLTLGELEDPMKASRFEAAFDACTGKADRFQTEVADALDRLTDPAAATVKGWISKAEDEEGAIQAETTAASLKAWSEELMSAFVTLGWHDTAFKDEVVKRHFETSLQAAKEAWKRFELLKSLEEFRDSD